MNESKVMLKAVLDKKSQLTIQADLDKLGKTNIELNAVLSGSSLENINKQLKNIKINPIEVKLDTSSLTKIIESYHKTSLRIPTPAPSSPRVDDKVPVTVASPDVTPLSMKDVLGESFEESIQNAVSQIKEADYYLEQISKTSNIASSSLKQLGLDSYDAASKYGVTAVDYLKNIQSLSETGLNLQQSKDITNLSFLAQSISDLTAQSANQYLAATNQAFGYEGSVSKLNAVLDSQAQIADRNAIKLSDLAAATAATGSQSYASGLEVDKMTAAVGTMMAVTEEGGEATGQAFNTILMNLSKITGVASNGEILDIDKFRSVKNVLDEVGVSMTEMTQNGSKLRNPMDILKDLSTSYTSLPANSSQKTKITNEIGGSDGGDELNALLTNWSLYEKMLGDFQNASGTATAMAADSFQSIGGKMNEFSNAWNGAVANVLNSDLINFLVGTATSVVTLIDKLNLMPGILMGVGAVGFASLASNISSGIQGFVGFQSAVSNVSGIVGTSRAALGQMSLAVRGLSVDQAVTVLSTKGLTHAQMENTLRGAQFTASQIQGAMASNTMTAANTANAISFKSLTLAMRTFAVQNPALLAFMAITAVVGVATAAIGGYNRKQEEMAQKAKEAAIAHSDEMNSLDDQISKYKELKEQLDSGTLSMNEEVSIKEQLLDLQTSIVDKYGEETDGINLVNGLLKDQLGNLQELKKEKALDYVLENKKDGEKAIEKMNAEEKYNLGLYVNPNTEEGKRLKGVAESLSDQGVKMDTNEDGTFNIRFKGDATEAEKVISSFSQQVLDLEDEFGKGSFDIGNVLNYSGNSFKDSKKIIENYGITSQEYSKAKVITNKDAAPIYEDYTNAVSDYNEALSSGDSDKIEETGSKLAEVRTQVDAITSKVSDLSPAFDLVGASINTSGESLYNFQKALKDDNNLSENVDNIKKYDSVDLKAMVQADGSVDDVSFQNVIDEALKIGVISDQSRNQVNGLIDTLTNLNYIKLSNVSDSAHEVKSAFEDVDDSGFTASKTVTGFLNVEGENINVSNASKDLQNYQDQVDQYKEMISDINTEGISTDLISTITSNYPQLLTHLDSETGLREQIEKEIASTEKTAANTYENMMQFSSDFYKSSILSNTALVDSFFENYGIDLRNFATLAEAKAAVDDALLASLRKAWGDYYRIQGEAESRKTNLVTGLNNSISNWRGTDHSNDPGVKLLTSQDQKNVDDAKAKAEALQKEYDDIANKLESGGGVNFDPGSVSLGKSGGGSKSSGGGSSSSDTTSEFKETIDWLDEHIKRITNRISKFNAILDNSSSLKTQISLYKKLADEQAKLAYWNEKSADSYEKQYKKALKSLSAEDKKKVQSGAYTLETFKETTKDGKEGKEQKRYKKIQEALELRDNYYATSVDMYSAKAQLKEVAASLASLRKEKSVEKIDKYNTKIDTYEAAEQRYTNLDKKKEYIKKQSTTYKNINDEQKKTVKENRSDVTSSGATLLKLTKDKTIKATVDKNKGITDPDKMRQINTSKLNGKAYEAAVIYNAHIIELRKNQDELNLSTEEYKAKIVELAKTEFDNISNYYDSRQGNIDAREAKVQNEVALTEAKGQKVGVAYYAELSRLNNQRAEELKKERTAKQNTLNEKVKNKEIVKNSQAWLEMREEIYGLDAAIQETSISTVELNNTIRQLKWDAFDGLLSKFDAITSESDFLINLMSNDKLFDDNGDVTSKGLATQGQHALNYNVYMQKSDELKKELASLDTTSTDQAVMDRISALTQQRQEAILAAQGEKKAITDLVQQGIKAEIDAFGKLTEAKKKSLDQDKETKAYQKSITDKNNEIARVKKMIIALEGDDSQENKKRLRELKAQLAGLSDDLTATEDDHKLQEEKDTLDKSLADYTKQMEDYSENTELLFTDTLKKINDKSTVIGETIKTTANNVGYTVSTSITGAWSKAGNAVVAYSSTLTAQSTGILTVLSEMKTKWDEVAKAAEAAAKASIDALHQETKDGSSGENSTSTGTKISEIEKILATANGIGNGTSALNQYVQGLNYNQLSYQNMADIAKLLGIKGVTSENIKNDTAMKNKILEELKKLKLSSNTPPPTPDKKPGAKSGLQGNLPENLPFTSSVLDNYTTLPLPTNSLVSNLPFMSKAQSSFEYATNVSEGAVKLEIFVDRPANPDDFVNQLRSNKKLQDSLREYTVGRIVPHSGKLEARQIK